VTDFERSLALGGVALVTFGTRCCSDLFRVQGGTLGADAQWTHD
jgi:hypothetical protein